MGAFHDNEKDAGIYDDNDDDNDEDDDDLVYHDIAEDTGVCEDNVAAICDYHGDGDDDDDTTMMMMAMYAIILAKMMGFSSIIKKRVEIWADECVSLFSDRHLL